MTKPRGNSLESEGRNDEERFYSLLVWGHIFVILLFVSH